jgi:hypothetical protein
MRSRLSAEDSWEELRVGSAGVPLTVAPEFYRRVLINSEGPCIVARSLGLSADIGKRWSQLMKRHRCPSQDRRILLSLGYPERTAEEVAAAFGVTHAYITDCLARADALREQEPLSTELWEDVTEDTMPQDEIYARAAEVRRLNDLVKSKVSDRSEVSSHLGTRIRTRSARPWSGSSSRPKAGVA